MGYRRTAPARSGFVGIFQLGYFSESGGYGGPELFLLWQLVFAYRGPFLRAVFQDSAFRDAEYDQKKDQKTEQDWAGSHRDRHRSPELGDRHRCLRKDLYVELEETGALSRIRGRANPDFCRERLASDGSRLS